LTPQNTLYKATKRLTVVQGHERSPITVQLLTHFLPANCGALPSGKLSAHVRMDAAYTQVRIYPSYAHAHHSIDLIIKLQNL